jgi:predicted ATPase
VHPRHHNEGVPRFVELTDKLYDAAIEAARRQVTRAEGLLHQIEAEAEETRSKAKNRWIEIQELERNLEDMSAELLQSFARYNGVK